MASQPMVPKRPYLLRAMHQWMSDCGLTPHVIVHADHPGVQVPRAKVKDGRIVLNVSPQATQRLDLGNEWLELDARFDGRVFHVRVPIGAVLGIYARETGEGMVFSEQDPHATATPSGAQPQSAAPLQPQQPATPPPSRPTLKIVK